MAMFSSALLFIVLVTYQLNALNVNQLRKKQRYEVVIPQKLHSQHKRDAEGMYADLVQYGIAIEGKPLVLHLEKTEDLLSHDYSETRYLPDGTPITTVPENKDHCYYQGYVKDDNNSSVSLSACRGLSGMIHTQGRGFLIEPLKLSDSEEHAVFEAEEKTHKSCGVINTPSAEGTFIKKSRSSITAEKKEFLDSKKFIKIFVVADNSTFKKYNSDTQAVRKRIFEIINYVNLVYKAINVFVALVGIEIWESSNQFEVVTSVNDNLYSFSEWRKNNLLPRIPHNNAQLLTNIDFDGYMVGLAFMESLCNDEYSVGVIQDHSTDSTFVGATVAHELGHNLGMQHDTDGCSCSAGTCIMESSMRNKVPSQFSACSVQNFQDFIVNKMPLCMKDVPKQNDIQAPAVCGNKFKELGEECDCGTVEECTSQCCDAATCKLKPNAQCMDGECCADCKILKAGVVCRAIKDECDLADICDGTSSLCPNHFQVNGSPCKSDKGSCYNGKCQTLQSQCEALWGESSVVGKDSCFQINKLGANYGYCRQVDKKYIPCEEKDIKCGVLFCNGGSDTPNLIAGVISSDLCKGVIAPQGMVQNGTKCGDGLVCMSGACITIETAYTPGCADKCPKHSVCDHELQCVCEEGWVPPKCDEEFVASETGK